MTAKPSEVDLVIYHDKCSDGFGARYAAESLLGNHAEYHAMLYGDTPPDVTGKNVAILDFSFQKDVMLEMIKKANSLIIIDHHETAEKSLKGIPKKNKIFDMSHSGAYLAWEFFHPGVPVPRFIQYIEDRDLWKWEMPYSKEFASYFDMVPFEFEAFDDYMDDSVIDKAIERGSYILEYSKVCIHRQAEDAVERTWYDGKHKCLVLNASHWVSQLGMVLSHNCDFAVIWHYRHEERDIKVSLRSFHEDMHVGNIAAKIPGGGGHPKAAGFLWDKDIEELFTDDVPEDD